MIVLPSARGRRFLVRLSRGESLVEALMALAQQGDVPTAFVTAWGTLQLVEVMDAAGNVRLVGASTVVSLAGTLARRGDEPLLQLRAVVAPQGERELLSGELRAATAELLEVLVESLDDVALQVTAAGEWRTPAVVPAVAAPSPTQSSWAAAAAAAERAAAPVERPSPRRAGTTEPAYVPPPIPEKRREVQRPDTPEDLVDEPQPEKGAWVRHKQFGLCLVEGEDPDGALLIRVPSGAHKSVSLDFLRVLPAEIDGDRRIYPLEPRRK